MNQQHEAIEALKAGGYKLTKVRKALLEVLLKEHGPFSVDDLFNKLQQTCDVVTIYRNMDLFLQLGLVVPCEFGDGVTRYEFRSRGHHHHHIICTSCRQAETLEYCFVKEVERMIQDRGYIQVNHHLEFYALCPQCQKSS